MTVTEAPPAAAAQPPSRRRAPLRGAGLVLVAVAVAAAATSVLRYDPLAHGSGVLAFGRDRPGSVPLADATVTNALGSEFRLLDPAVGTRIGVALGLSNDGPFDVEVLAIGSPFPGSLFPVAGDIASAARGGSGEPYRAFRPFVLEAGHSRDVGVVVRAGGCPDGLGRPSLGVLVVERVPVTWRFAGITRTSEVELGFRGTVSGYPQCVTR